MADAGHSFLGRNVPRLTPDIRFWDATFRATARSLQGLNIDRLLFSHLRCLTVVKRYDVLNGLSGALRLRPALMVPKTDVRLLQGETLSEFVAEA